MYGRLGREEMLRHAEAWIAAWNRRDLDAVLADFSDQAEFRSPRARAVTGSAHLEGKAALAGYWQAGLAELRSLRFTLLSATCDVEAQRMVVHYIARLNDRPLRACEIFQFQDGQKVQAEALYGDEDAPATGAHRRAELTEAVHRYFDLMYSCDTSVFDAVFASTVQLHGYRDGRFVMWSAPVYRDILHKRQPPRSLDAVRRDEILTMDFASDTMAFVKVRVRIAERVFVDYLTWHRIDARWLITSKGFHLVAEDGSLARA